MESPFQSIRPFPRTSQACEACRAHKVRCTPSTDPKICKRCLDKNAACLFSTTSRTRRTSYNPRRTAKRTISQSQLPRSDRHVGDNFNPTKLSSSSLSEEGSQKLLEFQQSHRVAVEQLLPEFGPTSSEQVRLDAPRDSWNAGRNSQSFRNISDSQTIIATSDVTQYLSRYGSLQRYFPFVPLPSSCSARSMEADHPFLLLGILSATTVHETNLNTRLHGKFLRVLAEKAIVCGEKSLDIIQGILVQVAWYPMHLNPRSLQIYQILQIAIAMIVDLHFDESLLNNKPTTLPKQSTPTFDKQLSQSVQLAYLGACYLSSVLSVSFRRPNNLPYSTHTASSVLQLTCTHEVTAWDIELQRLIEIADKATKNDQLDLMTTNSLVATLERNLELLDSSSSTLNQQSPMFSLNKKYATVRIFSVAMENYGPKDEPHHSAGNDSQWRLPMVSRCFEATREFFRELTATPTAEYRNMTMMNWMQVCQALKIILKLCHTIPGLPEWDVELAQREAQISVVLESLCYRMQQLTSIGKPTEHTGGSKFKSAAGAPLLLPDYFHMMVSGLEILKDVYKIAAPIALTKNRDDQHPHNGSKCPILNGTIMNSEYWKLLHNDNVAGRRNDESSINELWSLEFDDLLDNSWKN